MLQLVVDGVLEVEDGQLEVVEEDEVCGALVERADVELVLIMRLCGKMTMTLSCW